MGSFNTQCFASLQTIATGDPCYIIPIKKTMGYEPVKLSKEYNVWVKSEKSTEEKIVKEFASFSFCNTTCYTTAFWQPVGHTISCKYDDYGKVMIDDIEINKQRIRDIFKSFMNKDAFYKTEQGENKFHEQAFDSSKFNAEDPIGSLERMWDVIQEYRVFVTHYLGQPTQFQFAIVSKYAYDNLVNHIEKRENWNDESNDIEKKLERIIKNLKECDCFPDDIHDERKIRSYQHGRLKRVFDNHFNNSEGFTISSEDSKYNVIEEFMDTRTLTDESKGIIREYIKEMYFYSALNSLNIKLGPIVYASQDYTNDIGKEYADFVKKTSDQISKIRE